MNTHECKESLPKQYEPFVFKMYYTVNICDQISFSKIVLTHPILDGITCKGETLIHMMGHFHTK